MKKPSAPTTSNRPVLPGQKGNTTNKGNDSILYKNFAEVGLQHQQKRVRNNGKNLDFSDLIPQKEHIDLHLRILGRNKHCIVAKNQKMGVVKNLLIKSEDVYETVQQLNHEGYTVWISLNTKEKDAIEGVTTLDDFWIDLDARPKGVNDRIATKEELEQCLTNAQRLRDYIGEKFDAVGFTALSGNGFHLHFPIPHTLLSEESSRREINEKTKAFAGRISCESGVEIDHTCDLRRVTTIIGSYNLKIPDHPLLTKWNIEDLQIDVEEARQKNSKLLEAIFNIKVDREENNSESLAGHENFEEILSFDEKLRDLYNGDWQKYGYKSRSEAEQAVLVALCNYGFDDDTITKIMDNCKISKWQERNDSYRAHSLKKAREFIVSYKEDDYSKKGEDSTFENEVEEEEKEEVEEPFAEPEPIELRLHDNFIDDYVRLMSKRTDAYPEYHFAVACSIVSRIIDKTFYLEFMQGTIYPNLWFFLLGDTTISRKTTSIELGCNLVKEDDQEGDTDGFFYPQSFSPEAFVEIMSDQTHGLWCLDEAGALLSSLDKSYMVDLRDFLNYIYENRTYHRKLRTKKKGGEKRDFLIDDPYLVILFATTPENFREYTRKIDLTSGWLARFLFFYPEYSKEWKGFEPVNKELNEEYTKLKEKKDALKYRTSGKWKEKMEISDEAMELFTAWQKKKEMEGIERKDKILMAVIGRLEVSVLKLALIFAFSNDDFREEIDIESMQEAIRIADQYLEPYARKIIGQVALDEENNLQEKILGILRRNKGVLTRRNLLKNLHQKIKDVKEALEALTASGEIEIEKEGKKILIKLKGYKIFSNTPIMADNKKSVTSVSAVTNVSNVTSVALNSINHVNLYRDSYTHCNSCDTCDSCDTYQPSNSSNPSQFKINQLCDQVFNAFITQKKEDGDGVLSFSELCSLLPNTDKKEIKSALKLLEYLNKIRYLRGDIGWDVSDGVDLNAWFQIKGGE